MSSDGLSFGPHPHSFNGQFIGVPNELARNHALSVDARAILIEMASHRDGWRLTAAGLARDNGITRDRVLRAIKQLREHGYVHFIKERAPGGTYASRYVSDVIAHPCGLPGCQDCPPESGNQDSGADLRKPSESPDKSDITRTTITRPWSSLLPIEDQGENTKDQNHSAVADATAPPGALFEPEPAPGASPGRRGTRLPDGWTPDRDLKTWTVEQLAGTGAAPGDELAKFRDYWAAQPGQRGVKLDWPATWRNWIRKVREDADRRRGGRRDSDQAGVPPWERSQGDEAGVPPWERRAANG